MRNAYTFLHVWVPICMPQSVLVNKISASELRRKFINSVLLVGKAKGNQASSRSVCIGEA